MNVSQIGQFVASHWTQELAALTTTYTVVVEIFSRISLALPTPTADSSNKYKFWFVFVNNLARNPGRANYSQGIESSPNFIPAAEAYMQKKLNGQLNQPGGKSNG